MGTKAIMYVALLSLLAALMVYSHTAQYWCRLLVTCMQAERMQYLCFVPVADIVS
jgi:hypothetical protein